jgi:hypothetical protein
MATVEEPVQVPAGGLNPPGGNHRRDEFLRRLAGILLALGVVVVVAAFIPGLPGGIPDPRQSDLVLAPLVAAGLLLLVASGVVRGVRADSRHARPALAGPAISARVEFALVASVVAVFAGAVSLGIAQRIPFGWDESVYALISRHWLFGTPASGWGPYRPPGLSVLAVIPNLFTSNEAAFRAIGLVFGCLTVLAVWLVARRLGGVAAGLVAGVVIASAQPIQINAGSLLNDVPAVGLLALLVAVLWRVMEDDRSGWSILWIAPIAALSFYVRYGAAVPIALIAATALVVWPRRIAADWPKALATVGLLLLLLLPHLVYATIQTGTPWGIGLLASIGAQAAYPGQAVVTDLAWLPYFLVGPLGAIVAIVGLITWVISITAAIRRRTADRATRALTLLIVPAIGQIAFLGMTILPQARYIYLAMTLLIVAGAIGLAKAWQSLGIARAPVGWLAAGLLGVYLAGSVALVPHVAAARRVADEWLRDGAQFIAAHSTGDCSVLASDVPQITWYSRCAAYAFRNGPAADRDQLLRGHDRWLVIRRDGLFQPAATILDQYLARTLPDSRVLLKDGSRVVRAELYRFAVPGA